MVKLKGQRQRLQRASDGLSIPKIASLHFFERSGIATIYVTDNIRALCTRSLSATKIISEWPSIRKVGTWAKYIL